MSEPVLIGVAVVFLGSLLFVGVLALVGWRSRGRNG
jgi:hypothetical protein